MKRRSAYLDPEKLAEAWKNTPTKWYPLPVFIGALLLVAINYRKRHTQSGRGSEPQVHVDNDGREVLRLRGPFQVNVISPGFTHCETWSQTHKHRPILLFIHYVTFLSLR